jgi:hypothetical protein
MSPNTPYLSAYLCYLLDSFVEIEMAVGKKYNVTFKPKRYIILKDYFIHPFSGTFFATLYILKW